MTPHPGEPSGSEEFHYVEEDWTRFRGIDRLVDHWDRPGWSVGRRSYHWMICLGWSQPLREVAQECQAVISAIPTLGMVPLAGLHLTLQKVGFTDEVPTTKLAKIVATAQRRLAGTPPIPLRVGPLAGSTGAIRFSAGPHRRVRGVRLALRQALAEGDTAVPARATEFVPHVSIAYNRLSTDAAPVIDLVTGLRSITPVTVEVSRVELVELRREDRSYAWDVLATVTFAATGKARSATD